MLKYGRKTKQRTKKKKPRHFENKTKKSRRERRKPPWSTCGILVTFDAPFRCSERRMLKAKNKEKQRKIKGSQHLTFLMMMTMCKKFITTGMNKYERSNPNE